MRNKIYRNGSRPAKIRLLVGAALLAILLTNQARPAKAGVDLLDFTCGGKVLTDFVNSEDVAATLVIQPDGKIVVAGHY